MGVRGLQSFIRKHEDKYLLDFKLQDTKLIIDGSSLLYFLHMHYETESKYGGNYDHFYTKCTELFKTLLTCNVTPVVVFDGADDPNDMKLDTILKRLDDRFKKVVEWKTTEVLPVLSKITLCQVLVDQKIPHMACIYEADREIAVLAIKWNCPILSDDSDFYVYSLNGGTILMECIAGSVCTDEAGKLFLPVKLYQCNNVLKDIFKMENDKYMYPVFATLVGNDYFDSADILLKSPKNQNDILSLGKKRNIDVIVKWMGRAKFESGKAALKIMSEQMTPNTKKKFETSVDLYLDINKFSMIDIEACLSKKYRDNTVFLHESAVNADESMILRDRNGLQLPSRFVRNAIECNMDCSFILNITQNHRLLFKAQAEMHEKTSSFQCSEQVRRVIYGLVLTRVTNNKSEQRRRVIQEFHRKRSECLQVKPNESLEGISELPCLESIPDLLESERKAIVLAAFGASLASSEEEDMNTTSQIIILILALWQKNYTAPECHLHALIIGMIALHIFSPTEPEHRQCLDIKKAVSDTDMVNTEEFKKRMEKHFYNQDYLDSAGINKEFVHNVSRFQAVYLHTYHLNQLLSSPICIPSPYMILNSTFTYSICFLLEEEIEQPKQILCGEESPLYLLFTKWRKAVRERCKCISK